MKVKQAVAAAAVVAGLISGLAACGDSADSSTGSSDQAVTEQTPSEETPDLTQQMVDWHYNMMESDSDVWAVVYHLGELEMIDGQDPGDVGINMDGCAVIPDDFQDMIDNSPQPPVDPDTFKKAEEAYLEGINLVCDAVSKWDMDWQLHSDAVIKINASFDRSEKLQEEWSYNVADQVPELSSSISGEWSSPWDPQWHN
jgi:hypothetical protein